MKTYFTSLLCVTALSCVIVAGTNSPERHRNPEPTLKSVEFSSGPAMAPSPERSLPPSQLSVAPLVAAVDASVNTNGFADASTALERVTRASVADINSVPDNLNRSIDANITNWKSHGGVTTSATENKLELARTDFAQKVRTLTLADEETWKTAKSAALTSLEALRRAYEELIAVPDRA